MSDFRDGALLIARGIVSLHYAGHTNIEILLRSFAKKYKYEGIEAFLSRIPDSKEGS